MLACVVRIDLQAVETYQKLKKSLISLSSVLAAMFATWTVFGEDILTGLMVVIVRDFGYVVGEMGTLR